jgi:hypothetical protein
MSASREERLSIIGAPVFQGLRPYAPGERAILFAPYLTRCLPSFAPDLASVAPTFAPFVAACAPVLAPLHSYGLCLSD